MLISLLSYYSLILFSEIESVILNLCGEYDKLSKWKTIQTKSY